MLQRLAAHQRGREQSRFPVRSLLHLVIWGEDPFGLGLLEAQSVGFDSGHVCISCVGVHRTFRFSVSSSRKRNDNSALVRGFMRLQKTKPSRVDSTDTDMAAVRKYTRATIHTYSNTSMCTSRLYLLAACNPACPLQ